MQITIQKLMLLVAVMGLDLGAFTAASSAGPSGWPILVLMAVTTGLLAASILGAMLRWGVERAIWLGMAIFGWAFFLPAIALMAGGAAPEIRSGIYLSTQAMAVIGGGVARLFTRNNAALPPSR